ncbi:hypothetical protein WR25_02447 [Diploscapter pachys]|uniref:Uncharacterized protein n=1 Tax=Diploscapter pachys TaxID=2018661 RepID=A0A2A2KKJ4_9BILA|nr:hypothetical protein WR25_02447 [Diploscapter pachys]
MQMAMYSNSIYAYLRTLDPQANEDDFSWVLAISSIGQGVGSFIFGHFAEKPSKIRKYLFFGMILSTVSNIPYLCLPFFESKQVILVMMVSRFVAGLGITIALLRYFASTHSDKVKRSKAMALLSAGSAFGSLIGSGIIVFYSKALQVETAVLNTYTITPILSILSSLAGFAVLLCLRPNRPSKDCEKIEYQCNNNGSKEKIAFGQNEVKHDNIALFVCIYTRFAQNFMQAALDTFGQPYLMILYMISKKDIIGNKMGNAYMAISTQDPNDVMKANLRKSKSHGLVSSVEHRKTPHLDTITALLPVRPGMLLAASKDRSVSLNNMDTGECILRNVCHSEEVTKIAYRNAVGKHVILTGSRDQTIKLWQFNNGALLKTFNGHQFVVTGLATVDDSRFVSGSRDTSVRLWDLETGKEVRRQDINRNIVTHIVYHNSTGVFAQSSEDKEIKIWDTRDLKVAYSFPRKEHIQMHCDFFPDGTFLVSSSNGFNGDGCELTIWDVRTRKAFRELRGHEGSVTCVSFVPQQMTFKKLIASVSADQTIRLWNAEEGGCLWTEEASLHGDNLTCTAISDGQMVVGGAKGTMIQYKLQSKAGRIFLHQLSTYSQTSLTTSNSSFNTTSKSRDTSSYLAS